MASLLVCLVIPITTLYVVQLLKKCKYQLNSTMIILIVIQNIISQNPTFSLSFSPSSSPTQFPLQSTTTTPVPTTTATTHVPLSTQFPSLFPLFSPTQFPSPSLRGLPTKHPSISREISKIGVPTIGTTNRPVISPTTSPLYNSSSQRTNQPKNDHVHNSGYVTMGIWMGVSVASLLICMIISALICHCYYKSGRGHIRLDDNESESDSEGTIELFECNNELSTIEEEITLKNVDTANFI
eukprot:17897_1